MRLVYSFSVRYGHGTLVEAILSENTERSGQSALQVLPFGVLVLEDGRLGEVHLDLGILGTGFLALGLSLGLGGGGHVLHCLYGVNWSSCSCSCRRAWVLYIDALILGSPLGD